MGAALVVLLAAPFLMLFALSLAFALDLVLAYPLMWAWNYVIPGLFSLHPLSYWQAVALLVVCTLTVKSTAVQQSTKG